MMTIDEACYGYYLLAGVTSSESDLDLLLALLFRKRSMTESKLKLSNIWRTVSGSGDKQVVVKQLRYV